MNSQHSVSRADFEPVLTPENIRIFQVIFAAIGGGVLLFALVVGFLGLTSTVEEPAATDVSIMQTLSLIHALLLLTVLPVSRLLYTRLLAQGGPPLTANLCMTRIRTAEIVRLTMLEGVALLGLVVCLLGAFNGVLTAQPIYWLNLASSVVLLAFVSQNLPTADRLNQTFRAHFE